MSEDIYNDWKGICKFIVNANIKNWKQLNNVYYMLEHINRNFGELYLKNLLLDDVSLELIKEISLFNDSYGDPKKEKYFVRTLNYDTELNISPSTLRYIRHAFDICNMIEESKLDNINIIEIGGGYGGLCLVLNILAKKRNINITNYFIYDLLEVQNLQKFYLSNFEFIQNVVFKDSNSYGADLDSKSNSFLVSNYAISEIPREFRLKYLKNLIPNIKRAYFVWNTDTIEDLPINRISIESEIPNTGKDNKIIRI